MLVTFAAKWETPFRAIFVAYVDRLVYNWAVTRFFYLNVVVDRDTTPEDQGLPDGCRINVVSFGWIFTVVDLHYFDQWGEPPSHERGTLVKTP